MANTTSHDLVAEPELTLPLTEPDRFAPSFPLTVDQLDVNPGFLADLALKAATLNADSSTASVADTLHLGLMITDGLLQRLYDEKLVDRKGMIGLHNHRYGLTERGWQRVAQLMEQCSYIGAAPVSLESYSERIVNQVRSRPPVTKELLDSVMQGLVLPESVKRRLGVVASSGRSLFLSGPPGNGKTAMARALVNAIPGAIWIPYAIEVDGQVIRVFDKHDHHPVSHRETDFDRRWVKIKPPLVTVGGELTIQSLDLTYTDSPRYYEAPFQLKANGGVLVVDDLGRQRCSARELLNRWIVPLEYRTDYLTLSTGKKIQVPFEQIVIFATNLKDTDLVDGAFMRRMGYRLFVDPPDAATYRDIFTKYAAASGLTVPDTVMEYILHRYRTEGRQPHACEPRDLIQRAVEICKFDRQSFELSIPVLNEAWEGYFGGAGFAPAKP